MSFHRPAASVAILLALFHSLIFTSCKEGDDRGMDGTEGAGNREVSAHTNVLLITLDTTRADRLGCYGYEKGRTPNLDRVAMEGVVFENAFSQVPLTIPSHATILTGRYPYSHGVRDNGDTDLSPGEVTIAEVLKGRGYSTAASVGAFVCDSGWGFGQGFDRYYENFTVESISSFHLGKVSRRGGEVVDDALDFLEEAAPPFFLWVHLYDPHTPYSPPEPFREWFKDALYDGEIAYMDSQIGRLLNGLRERGLMERTLIIAVGDHGEGLGDHGEDNHGIFIYNSTLQVPLLIRFPGGIHAGRRIEEVVGLTDILPTITGFLQIAPPGAAEGRDLIPLIRGGGEVRDRFIYSESLYPRFHYGWNDLRSLQNNDYKLIFTPKRELYHLKKDPGELKNLYPSGEGRELAGLMEKEIASIIEGEEEREGEGPASLDAERLEKLRALGYVGVFAKMESLKSPLPDIKDKIPVLKKLKKIQKMTSAGESQRAISLLEGIVEEEQDMIDAFITLGIRYSRQGMYDEAVDIFLKALKKVPDQTTIMVDLAGVYIRGKEVEKALALLKRVLEIDSKNIPALNILCDIFIAAKDYGKANEFAARLLAIGPSFPSAHLARGMYAFEKGDHGEAERSLLEALKLRPDAPHLHSTLSKIHMKRGETRKALEMLEEEVRLFPAVVENYPPLIYLYQRLNMFEEEAEAIEKLIVTSKKVDPVILFRLALARFNNREYEKAREAAERGLELKWESWHLHLIMANIMDKMGDEAGAREEKGLAERYRREGEEWIPEL